MKLHFMKYKFFILTLTILLLMGNIIFAHSDEGQLKKEQDTTSLILDKTQVSATTTSQNHNEMDNHSMIKESEIVDASMSDFPNLHPLVVHFPIVLLLLAVFAQIGSFIIWKKQLNWVAFLLLAGGFLGAYVASTYVHPHTTNMTEAASLVLEKHDSFALYTIWLSGIGLLLKAASLFLFKDKLWFEIIIALLLTGAAYSVSQAGHYGATLAHIHGVGIQGNFIESHNDGHEHSH